MTENFFLQGFGNISIVERFRRVVVDRNHTEIRACAAYVTVQGVSLIRTLFGQVREPRFQIIVGLDDYVSDPDAIEQLLLMKNTEVKVAGKSCGHSATRFHPKIYIFGGRTDIDIFVGSPNMTGPAFATNVETVWHRSAGGGLPAVEAVWNELWNQAVIPSSSILRDYRREFALRRDRNPIYQEIAQEERAHAKRRLRRAVSSQSITSSNIVWTELGKNTAGGNQLDIAMDIAAFLGLSRHPGTGAESYVRIDTSDAGARSYQLSFTKGMWRFMYLKEGFTVPLRPDLSRPSPYILVIERTRDGKYSMKVVRKTSREAKKLRAMSEAAGSIFMAGGRKSYGWL